jgi:hypothetical protein
MLKLRIEGAAATLSPPVFVMPPGFESSFNVTSYEPGAVVTEEWK